MQTKPFTIQFNSNMTPQPRLFLTCLVLVVGVSHTWAVLSTRLLPTALS